MASLKGDWNPNHLKSSDFTIYVGNSINECEEFVWRHMEDFKNKFGNPTGEASHIVNRFLSVDEMVELAKKVIDEGRWYKGDKI